MSPQSTINGNGTDYNKVEENNVEEGSDQRLHVGRLLASPPEGEEVVITGLTGQFPDSDNVYHFQENLFNKIDMVSKDTRRWEHTHPEIPHRGGKLNAIDKFDAGFFGVHYRQAEAMCPMVRLYLESAVECIMDAGLHPSELEDANCGVFVGACFSETERTCFHDRLQPQYNAILGCERSMLANRVSYFLKLKGPSFITDTACSSSLYALEQAYRMIRTGKIDCAIVGGTNICLHPFVSLQFARLGVLSMDGTCKSFDAEGSGYARSEAVCSIFLQKSKVAKRIYCQVVHAKTNCDGYKSQGITYPSGDMQKLLLSQFYEECRVNPADLVFLEAHGTGTRVGDPEECVAIDEVFCKDREAPLMIGSVKSSIGHTEPSSGLCSITKAIIALETGYIPPNLHFNKPREGVEPLERGKLKVVTEKTPFENDNGLIGVNSFGFGGGNCHVLLRWNKKTKLVDSPCDNLPRLVCVSGRTEKAIYSLLNSVSSRPLDAEHIRLMHNVFRKHIPSHQFRGYSILSKDGEIKKTAHYFSEDLPDLYVIFGDVGGSWHSLGKHLLMMPIFAVTVQRIHEILSRQNINITEILLNKKTESLPNVIGSVTVQIGIVDVLNHIGLKPKAVMGDSLGELICAYYDGVLSLEEILLSAVAIHNALTSIMQPLVRHIVHLGENQVRKLLPSNVEIIGIISKNEVVISGLCEATAKLVKTLQDKRILTESVDTTVSFMKKDIEKIKSQLAQRLKKITTSHKKKTEKWMTFSNNLSVADYIVQSLANPSKYSDFIEATPPKSVLFEVGPGFLSTVLQKRVAAKKVSMIRLNHHDGEYNITGFLDTLGCLHNYGYNFEVDKLYPEIQFPVSRGTPMVSPYIKWQHDAEWTVFSYKSEINHKTGARVVLVAPAASDWKFTGGHLIDGMILFPASAYLTIVWETLALINNSMTADMDVVFENVKFNRATHLKDRGATEFIVMIQRGSGSFEVIESGSDVVTGTISLMAKDDQIDLPHYDDDDDCIKMQTKDIYKDLRLRGYNYKGSFKGITETNLETDRGLIKWDGNWITFIDSMFQMKILHFDSRTLYVPTGIDRLAIDGKKHIMYSRQLGENPKIPVYLYSDCDIIKSGGIEVRGLKASSIPRRKARGEPVLEKYVFIPNEAKVDVPLSVRLNMQICLENLMVLRVKAVEVIDECTKEDVEPLASYILASLGDLPLIQPTMKLLTKEEITIPNVVVENSKLNTESDCLLVVGSNIFRRTQVLHTAFGSLKDNQGFVICREDVDFDPSQLDTSGIDIVTIHRNEKETIVMVKKSSEYETPMTVDTADPQHEFTWVPELQDAVKADANVVVYAQNEPLNGILGLVNCLRREPGGVKVRCVFVVDPDAPKFDVANPFYAEELRKHLAVNVFKDGRWGTYRHVLLDNLGEIQSEHCYVNVTTIGDLSSLRWISGPLTINKELSREKKMVCIYNTALNFRDIMTASGRISADVITLDRLEQECVQGFEFSGRTLDGKRVMGVSISGALANMIAADSYLLHEVPDIWTLEQAVTIPLVYSTVLYALIEVGQIKRGQSVLIHSGAGGVGQAAIRIALFHGCKVYTTCGSDEKRVFLKKRYPQLTDSVIGNSRDTHFEQMILKETVGRGVDIVLNSLAEDKLMASVRCLARGGKFLEIGKFDLARDTGLRTALLEKECSIHGIMLDMMFNTSPKMKLDLYNMLQCNIKSGAVRPLNTHMFKSDEVEKAFRFMASGKHMGKVVINLKKEEPQKVCVPEPVPIMGLPRYYCSNENTYVICGGLGGFGLELADWLVLRGAKKVVLTSRNGVKTGYQASRIRLWKSYGITIQVSTADIMTLAGCEEMLKEAENLGPVAAIFNLAVVLKDALFTNQSVDTFKESFGPKAEATKFLDQVSRKLCPTLKDFVIFSSVSCGRGNPGQTNYGMANSVMERICEKRRQEGLAALAIEWGAIGEVGLVAEMQEEHTELEISGTLQQKISSCLQVMDNFLKQKYSVVGSMVVAEKRVGAGGADNVVDAVANILGITDLKTVSIHATLAELGMDSMTGVEIKQTLEREYEVFLTSQDLRSLTFSRLQEIDLERDNAVTKGKKVERLPVGMELILRLMGDEATANTPVIRLPSRTDESESGPKVVLLPGIEGVAKILTPLTKNLNCHAQCVQFCYDTPEDTVMETASNLLPHFEQHLSKTEPFKLVAYSFGCLIGLEVVALLEQKGYTGTVILIDGSPKMLSELLKQQVMIESEDQFQTSLICVLMSLYMPFETILKNREKVFRANGLEERIKTAFECAPSDSPHRPKHQRDTTIGIYKRLKGLMKYTPSFPKIKSQVKLFKPKHISMQNLPEDYQLSELCENPVQVSIFEGNHITILKNQEVADAISIEAGAAPVIAETPVVNGETEKMQLQQIEVKQI